MALVLLFYICIMYSLGTNTKIPNFEHWMSEHRTFWTSHFGPKSNFEHVEHHKNPTFRELFGILWCSTCSKFDFGPKCDVRKVRCLDIQCSECSKFGILVFVPRLAITKQYFTTIILTKNTSWLLKRNFPLKSKLYNQRIPNPFPLFSKLIIQKY